MTGRTAACRCALSAVIAVVTLTAPVSATTAPARTITAPTTTAALTAQPGSSGDTLRALAVLHSYGYTINTPTRADRAIRHWQRANGLAVDGQIDPQTLASLGLGDATATAAAVRDNLPPLSVEQIIRDVWPDDLEEHALAIAWRESRFTPTARNACCFGLFQINWNAHRSWLAELGMSSASQLLDAATNARAAFALYQRDGWRPWSL